jgi:hypothetical protein
MVCAVHLPDLVFVYLSSAQPQNFGVICGFLAIEQFGYGFGFTAMMMYMIMVADGPYKTAHYAICTGLMALGMMVPGMWSGACRNAGVPAFLHLDLPGDGSGVPDGGAGQDRSGVR